MSVPYKDAVKKATTWKAWYEKNQAARREYKKVCYQRNLEANREKGRCYYREHREAVLANRRMRWQRNQETERAKARAYYQRNRDRLYKANKSIQYKTLYGLTLEQVEELLVKQGQRCAICNEPFDGRILGRSPVIDHDHTTNKVRAILHRNCNSGLGMFNENPKILESAAQYLRGFKE